jgi:hypothetical protein
MGMGSATNGIKWRLEIVGSKKLGLSDLFRSAIYVPFVGLVFPPLFVCMHRMVGFVFPFCFFMHRIVHVHLIIPQILSDS